MAKVLIACECSGVVRDAFLSLGHFAAKRADGRQQMGVDFFMLFTRLTCKWAIENPVGIMSTLYRKPDQIIQPHEVQMQWRNKLCTQPKPSKQKQSLISRQMEQRAKYSWRTTAICVCGGTGMARMEDAQFKTPRIR